MRSYIVLLLLLASPQLYAEVPGETTVENKTSPAPVEGGDDQESIRAVILQNKAAREGIKSYSMKIAWERREYPETPVDAPLPEGRVVSYGEGIWMEEGEKWHVHRTKRWQSGDDLPSAGIARPADRLAGKEYSSWTVYNGEYFAEHNGKLQGRIRLYPQEAIDAKQVYPEGELFPNPLGWGFGFSGQGYLDVEYEKSMRHGNGRWAREDFEADDGPKIRIRRTIFNRGENIPDHRTEFTVDPQRDFLLVALESWELPDTQLTHISMTLGQLADGRWYPTYVTSRDRDRIHKFTFSEVKFNIDIDDVEFTIDAFDMDFSMVRLNRKKASGAETVMLYRDGQWIPQSLVPKHLRPVLPGDETRFSSKERRNSAAP